jgi:hypothetical protein
MAARRSIGRRLWRKETILRNLQLEKMGLGLLALVADREYVWDELPEEPEEEEEDGAAGDEIEEWD